MFGDRINICIFRVLKDNVKPSIWLAVWIVFTVLGLGLASYSVYAVDPFFHYHSPDLTRYYYVLDNQRSQNDGIIRHFDYDGIITGTSMASGFKTTEADTLFNRDFIKVTYSGAYYKELNDNIDKALRTNPKIKTVIRSLDLSYSDKIDKGGRMDLGVYPNYLYDNNPFNDVRYLLNRDVVFGRVYRMIDRYRNGAEPGITPFDYYPEYMEGYSFGINTIAPEGIIETNPDIYIHLSDVEKEIIRENVEQNVVRIADEHPAVEFYYYYPPYSMAFWGDAHNDGTIYRWLEVEEFVTELVVPHSNIHLFSFFGREDIISDLNNYKDTMHCASWINSLMLKDMKEDKHRLTEDNYRGVLKQEYDMISQFDYASMNDQEDYEADYYAAALLNKELTGADPVDLTSKIQKKSDLTVNLNGHNYLFFCGRKTVNNGYTAVCVYNDNGEIVGNQEIKYTDYEINHQYVVDLSQTDGCITISIENVDGKYYVDKMVLY